MELVDRYLQAVKKHLPIKRQDDIAAELRADIESQIEDKEAEVKRSLTPGEVEAILKRMGPPILVAARYQPQQQLIGPGLFPVYIYVLRLAMLWAAVVYTVVCGVQILLAEPGSPAIGEAILRVPGILFMTAAWVTAAFAAFEFAGARGLIKFPSAPYLKMEWSPSDLPPLEREQGGKGRSYAQAAAEVIFGYLALTWLLLIPHHPYLLFGPGIYYLRTLPYALAPVWSEFYAWIVALNVVQVGWRSVELVRGTWTRPHPAQGLVFKAMGMAPLVLLLTAKDHMLVTLKAGAQDMARDGLTLANINQYSHKILLLIFAISVLQLAADIWKAGREAMRGRAAAR